VELPDKIKVQVVQNPTPRRVKAQPPSQPTEDQIQALMGDVSDLSLDQKKIRQYAVLKYGPQWRDHNPAEVRKDAEGDPLHGKDPLYKKEVGDILHHITTFRRGLRDKDRKK